MVGGMVSEGRVCCWPPRLVCGVPLPFAWWSPLNGGSGGLCVVPVFGLGPPLRVVLAPLALSSLLSSLLLSAVCVLCHGIVGLVLCLCDRVVSLCNGGDGLCWVEGRVVSTVHCRLFMCCGVCCLVVLCCGIAGCVVSSLVFPVFPVFPFISYSLCCWCSG